MAACGRAIGRGRVMSRLRRLLLVVGIALLLTGLGLLLAAVRGPGVYVLLIGTALLLGTLLERWRYHPPAPPPGARWERTGERFEDPHSGKIMEVLYDPGSGQRRYEPAEEVRDGPPGPGAGSASRSGPGSGTRSGSRSGAG
jgi:hypothetical protein